MKNFAQHAPLFSSSLSLGITYVNSDRICFISETNMQLQEMELIIQKLSLQHEKTLLYCKIISKQKQQRARRSKGDFI